MKYYKILKDGKSCNGGSAEWFLPTKCKPGKWMPAVEGKLVPCQSGYHIVKADDILQWVVPDAQIFEVEPRGRVQYAGDKGVCTSVRLIKQLGWDDRIARLFACDCAEHTLSIFEKKYPDDKRPRRTIEVARRFTEGKATQEELAAAEAAARDAAEAAAWAAAWAAARVAAWAAARDAAEAAAWAAERQWQTKRLLRYLYGKTK